MSRRFARVMSRLGRRHHSAYVTHDVNTTLLPQSSPSQLPNSPPPPHPPNFTPSNRESMNVTMTSGIPTAPQMEECLGTFDLVSLGVGSCVGTGMYLTAGIVASTLAGPGGVVSFLVAGAVSMLTGLCYAELAGLCPKSSGSAYMYAYVTAGELVAFVIGWGLVVEYVIGTAAGASALSETLDSLCNGLFSAYTKRLAEAIGLPKLDLVAAAICAALTLLLASGAEMSVKVNNVLNLCNLLVLVTFVLCSLFLGSASNWKTGGFLPMGVSGVVGAIPTCYFAFIGFDALAATGAEAKNPSTAIPRSILLSILLSAVAYVVVILALTYDLPFHLLPPHTAMTEVFPRVNFLPGKYVVAVGAVAGEFAATFGSLFPLPRVLMAMATDGLIFRQLAYICPKRHTPVTATICSGLVAAFMATFFRLAILIDLVLIGTLLAYILVTFALLHMRYVVHKPLLESSNNRDKLLPDNDLSEEMFRTSEQQSMKLSATCSEGSVDSTRNSSHGNSVTKGRFSKEFPKTARISPQGCDLPEAAVTEKLEREEVNHSSISQKSSSEKHATMSGKTASSSLKKEGGLSSASYNSFFFREESERGENYENFGELEKEHESVNQSQIPSLSEEQTAFYKRKTLLSKSSSLPDKGHLRIFESRPLLEMNTRKEITEEDAFHEKSSHTEQRLVQQESPRIGGCEKDENATSNSHFRRCTFEGKNSRSSTKRTFSLPSKVVDFVDYISTSSFRVQTLLYAIYGMEVVLCMFVSKTWRTMADGSSISLCILGVLSAIFCVLVGVLTFLPETKKGNSFRAPLVPSLPIFVAMVNIFLMTSLSTLAWLLFGLWMSVGLLVYILYGVLRNDKWTSSTSSSTSISASKSESISTPSTASSPFILSPSVTVLMGGEMKHDDNDEVDGGDGDDDDHDDDEEKVDEKTKLLAH